MRKLGHNSIQSIIDRACKEFLEDDSAPDFVTFFYKDRYIDAIFEWDKSKLYWYLSYFDVVYPSSGSEVRYKVNADYDISSAWCW